MAAGIARPDMAHAALAHELRSRGCEQKIIAIRAAGERKTSARNGTGVCLGLSSHGLLLRCLPSVSFPMRIGNLRALFVNSKARR